MSVEAMAIVLHHSRATGTDKVILLGIANHDGDGGAWPSIDTLALYANVEERAAQRAVRRLERLGEVVVHLQTGGPSGIPSWRRTNRYEIALACPATCDRTRNHRVSNLWIKGVSPTTPGVAHDTRGVSPTPPGGVSPTTPEPSIEPSKNPGVVSESSLQYGRALCSVCSRPEDDCRSRVATSGHEFAPSRLRSVR